MIKVVKDQQGRCRESFDLITGTPNVKVISSTLFKKPSGQQSLPVFTHRVQEAVRRGSYWIKHVRYPWLALELILAGEMEFRTEEQRQIAGPGALYVIPPGSTVRFTCHDGKPVRKMAVIMGGENLKGILITLGLPGCVLLHLAAPEILEKKMLELAEAMKNSDLENSARSYRFLLDLAELTAEENSLRTPFLRAVAVIDSGFQENLQIPAVASRAGVSESTLRRMFKSELHCSPLEYLNQVRLKFAAAKLLIPSLRVKEVALMSGFLSSARFCTAFRKKYGLSPGEFQKRYSGDTPQ